MDINLTEDIVPVTEFKKATKATFEQVHRLLRSERELAEGKGRPMKEFIKEFKKSREL